jgi:hypothetical protein
MTHEEEKKSNQFYEKPKLRIIPLVAEEVLAVKCKAAPGASGKNGGQCGFAPCSVPGSYGS